MKMRIRFVLNVIDSHSLSRIDEFIKMGYEVKAYAFDRGTTMHINENIVVIGKLSNSMPYISRIPFLFNKLNKLFKDTHDTDDDIWYYFDLQICFFCSVLNKNKKYIYEELDMTHLNIKNKLVRQGLERLDKRLISQSILSLFTSEGFLQYHYNKVKNYPRNVIVKPNKIHPKVWELPLIPKSSFNPHKLRFGFVGFIRYQSIYNIAEYISKNFPQHEFHFYGDFIVDTVRIEWEHLQNRKNVFFHGPFINPDGLPCVYSNIDVVISTYDVSSLNVLYAEPNKLYESIFFRTPIVVSKGTFLAQQVEKYQSGWAVDARNESDVCELVRIVEREINKTINSIQHIPQEMAVNSSESLEHYLSQHGINK